MQPLLALALFSGIAVTAGILLSSYFLFLRSEDRIKRSILAGLFISISLRVGKSIFYYMTDIPDIGVSIGFLGLASIGPCLWLFVKYEQDISPRLKSIEYSHFLPALTGFFLILFFGGRVPGLLYKTTTWVLLGYLAISYWRFSRTDFANPKLEKWTKLILICCAIVWGAFLFQMYSDSIMSYAIGAAIASLCIYMLLFYALQNPVLFPKNTSIHIDSRIVSKIKKAFEEERVYQKSALTLTQLAEELEEPSYLVTKAIKAEYGKSFRELTNYFRIQDVKDKLLSQNDEFVKIEGLAYDVGFNTPSAFYAAFKKETSLSPGEFRRRALALEQSS